MTCLNNNDNRVACTFLRCKNTASLPNWSAEWYCGKNNSINLIESDINIRPQPLTACPERHKNEHS